MYSSLHRSSRVSVASMYSAQHRSRRVSVASIYSSLHRSRRVSVASMYSAIHRSRRVSVASMYSALHRSRRVSVASMYSVLHRSRRVSVASMYSEIVYSLLVILFASYIGSLPPSNSLFDIIVDPRRIVDVGSFSWDVSSACIINSTLENFKSYLGIISDNWLFQGLVIEFSPHCIEI